MSPSRDRSKCDWHVCMYVCMYVYTHVYMCTCMHTYMYTCTHATCERPLKVGLAAADERVDLSVREEVGECEDPWSRAAHSRVGGAGCGDGHRVVLWKLREQSLHSRVYPARYEGGDRGRRPSTEGALPAAAITAHRTICHHEARVYHPQRLEARADQYATPAISRTTGVTNQALGCVDWPRVCEPR